MQNQLRVNVYLPIRLFQGRCLEGCPLKKDQVGPFKFSFVKAEFTVVHLALLSLKHLTSKFLYMVVNISSPLDHFEENFHSSWPHRPKGE